MQPSCNLSSNPCGYDEIKEYVFNRMVQDVKNVSQEKKGEVLREHFFTLREMLDSTTSGKVHAIIFQGLRYLGHSGCCSAYFLIAKMLMDIETVPKSESEAYIYYNASLNTYSENKTNCYIAMLDCPLEAELEKFHDYSDVDLNKMRHNESNIYFTNEANEFIQENMQYAVVAEYSSEQPIIDLLSDYISNGKLGSLLKIKRIFNRLNIPKYQQKIRSVYYKKTGSTFFLPLHNHLSPHYIGSFEHGKDLVQFGDLFYVGIGEENEIEMFNKRRLKPILNRLCSV